ncbi:MAG: hypothetical protein GY838_15215 [bacterium]|nr:hypothetical protein [bacterium]
MTLEAWIAMGCVAGIVVFGSLYRRASTRIWYRDWDGDGVSARSVCGGLSLIFLVVLLALGVRWLG